MNLVKKATRNLQRHWKPISSRTKIIKLKTITKLTTTTIDVASITFDKLLIL
ncbi:hypothetical protein AXX17_AT3G32200 [Arabidopsis thaliana]|uniref:Uncharacterized protein n=1 Tax=Arabidopsis thaliana TaxID=3702 RepID=A0A178V9V3_ARATH|nr:hypothetical protein AXX17_AT3G32200 [Arabidopsis thaliana]